VNPQERAEPTHRKWLVDFYKVDLDGDGKLTEAEYVQALKQAHGVTAGQEV